MGEPYEYADALPHGRPQKGRGAGLNPGNRYEAVRLHVLGEHLDRLESGDEESPRPKTQIIPNATRTIINRVPDETSKRLGFKWTINPYRGCEHGCIYCYARPDHERLGMSSGLDFETKILAKHDAPKLLMKELAKPSWTGEMIMMSGDTDCYQPIERELRITRGCLEVMAQCRQPVSIITKNRLILRDLDLLTELASNRATQVAVSITTLDHKLAMKMEPRAASPADRLRAVEELAKAGVPTRVMVAPIIPGLTDRETPAILQAAADAGACSAGYVLLRLPYQNKALFLDWLHAHFPDRASHIESLIRQTRGGELYDARWSVRQKGQGAIADQIRNVFKIFVKRCGLDRPATPLSREGFRRPTIGGQGRLFDV